MKMQASENHIKSSVPVEKKEKFRVSNNPALYKLLRTSLYPDKIRAVTQEIASNGRDAHREMGNPDVPIQIKLPNKMDPTFHVRDYGVGISPERMTDVFVVYGESTKRNDSLQTGGFGIGAKTPLAYSDQFNIETYYPDEDGQMWRRRYLAAIDNDECGDLIMIGNPEKTDEPRGAKVSLTVKPGDEQSFFRNVRRACSAWEPRPRVIGTPEFDWDEYAASLKGDGWFLLKKREQVAEEVPLALVDGIPYRLYSRSLLTDQEQYGSHNILSRAFKLPFVLEMNVGEVAVTGSRDAIEYTDQTKKVLRDRIAQMMEEMADLSLQTIQNADTLWEAHSIWRGFHSTIQAAVEKKTSNKVEWNGFRLVSPFAIDNADMHFFIYMRGERDGKIVTKRSKSAYFDVLKRERTWIHDDKTKIPPRARAMHLFRNNIDLNEIRVLMLPEGVTLDDPTEAMQELEKTHGVLTLARDLPGFSTVPKYNTPRAASGVVAQIKRPCTSGWEPADHEIDFEEEDVVFVQLYRGDAYAGPDFENQRSAYCVDVLQNHLDIKIYGVQTPFINKVPDSWRWLNDVIEEEWQNILNDPEVPALLAPEIDVRFDVEHWQLSHLVEKGHITLPEGGLLKEWHSVSTEDDLERGDALRGLANLLGKKSELDELAEKRRYKDYKGLVDETLPLLDLVGYPNRAKFIEEIQWYINQKDGPETLKKANAEDEMKIDEEAWTLRESRGLSWRETEKTMGLPDHNGNAARRAAMRHQKRLDEAKENAEDAQMAAAD